MHLTIICLRSVPSCWNMYCYIFSVSIEIGYSCFLCYSFCLSVLYVLGCGSGLSGETLTENGHQWIGLDISQSMLGMNFNLQFKRTHSNFSSCIIHFGKMIHADVALEREAEGDLVLADMGQVGT